MRFCQLPVFLPQSQRLVFCSVTLKVGNLSSTSTSTQSPKCQNRNRNTPQYPVSKFWSGGTTRSRNLPNKQVTGSDGFYFYLFYHGLKVLPGDTTWSRNQLNRQRSRNNVRVNATPLKSRKAKCVCGVGNVDWSARKTVMCAQLCYRKNIFTFSNGLLLQAVTKKLRKKRLVTLNY